MGSRVQHVGCTIAGGIWGRGAWGIGGLNGMEH